MSQLFDNPIKTKQVRKDVTASVYLSGVIQVGETKYSGYTLKEAIAQWRKDHPYRT